MFQVIWKLQIQIIEKNFKIIWKKNVCQVCVLGGEGYLYMHFIIAK